METTVSVQARLGSTRLPGKVLLSLGPKRILEWVVERCESVDGVDDVVVAVGDEPENDAIEEYCSRTETPFLVGPEDDLLARHLTVARETGCERLIRVTADCPFLPPSEVERLIGVFDDSDARYVTNVTDEMPIGVGADVLDVDVLEALAATGETHPVLALRENPEQWATVFSSSSRWRGLSDVHLAVDTPQDYWRLVDAYEAVGANPYDVANWLGTHC